MRSLRKARALAAAGATVLAHPSVPAIPTTNAPSPVEEFDAPNDLAREEREIWLKQAPHAFQNRTLTRASAMAFERYCKLVVLEKAEAASSGRGGPNHMRIVKMVNDLEKQFKLTASGEPLREAPPLAPVVPQAPPLGRLSRFRG